MALKATIYKANVQLSDLDRHYYQTLNLTIAQHPSETEQRMMVRLIAYLFLADEHLQFTKGLSSDDEPEIWQKDLTGNIQRWVELGTPSEERIRKACNRAEQVFIYVYGAGMDIWWQQIQSKLTRFKNLTILQVSLETSQALTSFISRTMELTSTIDDNEMYLANDTNQLTISPQYLLKSD